jgi:hypothetical protein
MKIAEGLELRPGAEGALPIRVRWATLVGNIAAVVGVHGKQQPQGLCVRLIHQARVHGIHHLGPT